MLRGHAPSSPPDRRTLLLHRLLCAGGEPLGGARGSRDGARLDRGVRALAEGPLRRGALVLPGRSRARAAARRLREPRRRDPARRWNEHARTLRENGYEIANVLSIVDPSRFVGERAQTSVLAQILLERFLIGADDGWIFRGARSYRGALQAEDEEAGAQRLVLALVDDPAWRKPERFLLLRETVRLLPLQHDPDSAARIRQLALDLAARDAGFARCARRSTTPPTPATPRACAVCRAARAAGSCRGVRSARRRDRRALQRTRRQPDAARPRGAGIRRRADKRSWASRPTRSPPPKTRPSASRAEAWRSPSFATHWRPPALPSDGWRGSRPAWRSRARSSPRGASWRRSSARAAAASSSACSRRARRRSTAPASRAPASARRSRRASQRTSAEPEIPLGRLRAELRLLSQRAGVGRAGARLPLRAGRGALPPARAAHGPLRAGPPARQPAALLRRRARFAGAGRRPARGRRARALRRARRQRPARAQPRPRARELVAPDPREPLAGVVADGISLLPETISDLPPVAGILTRGEGSSLSHVQLLARNLGIPNVVVGEERVPEVKARAGQPGGARREPRRCRAARRDGPALGSHCSASSSRRSAS